HTLRDRVGELRVDPLVRLLPLLDSDSGNRQRLRAYLASLAEHLSGEKAQLLEEITALNRNVEQLSAILQAQGRYAGAPPLVETTSVDVLLDESLQRVASALQQAGARLERVVAPMPPMQ